MMIVLFNSAFTKDPIYYTTYHGLILVAALMALLLFKKGNRKLRFLTIVLSATFIIEGVAAFTEKFSWLYHIFCPLEFMCFCLHYIDSCDTRKLNVAVKWCMFLFIPATLFFSITEHFQSLPQGSICLESFLIFIIYTHFLFNLNIDGNEPIYLQSDFWISIGVLMFFGGAFTFMGIYDTLRNMGLSNSRMGYGFIVKPLNIAFYICIITGLTCLIRKDYLTHSS